MQEDKEIQPERYNFDQWVMRHKVCIGIERFSTILIEQLEISDQVNNEEQDQEKPGQAHDQFSSDRRGKKCD